MIVSAAEAKEEEDHYDPLGNYQPAPSMSPEYMEIDPVQQQQGSSSPQMEDSGTLQGTGDYLQVSV